jgi:hypothetical protein
MQRMPVGFLEDVILARRYVEAYYANEANVPGWDQSELRTLARQIEMELAQEAIKGNG